MNKKEKLTLSAFILSSLLLTNQAYATGYSGPCLGGKIITANSYGSDVGGYCDETKGNCNGMTFCITGGGGMTWWSCHLWCQANNGTFATWDHVCPNTPTVNDTGTGACANIAGLWTDGWRSWWANHSTGRSSAIAVYLGQPTDAIRGRVQIDLGKNSTLGCICE